MRDAHSMTGAGSQGDRRGCRAVEADLQLSILRNRVRQGHAKQEIRRGRGGLSKLGMDRNAQRIFASESYCCRGCGNREPRAWAAGSKFTPGRAWEPSVRT